MAAPLAAALVLGLGLALGLGGCGDPAATGTSTADTTPKPYPSASAALADARARWKAAGIRDYDLAVVLACLCTDGATVRFAVRGGTAGPASVASSPAPNVPSPDTSRIPATVEAFFDVIEEAQRDDDRVEVTYDATTGAPQRVLLDPKATTSDDEAEYLVTLTRPLAGGAGGQAARDLATARAAWKALGLKDYTLVVTRSCFCANAGTVTSTVKAGLSVKAVTQVAAGGPTPPGALQDMPATVEALLDRVAQELATSAKVDVTYDERGVPTKVHADRILEAVDDEEDLTAAVTATP